MNFVKHYKNTEITYIYGAHAVSEALAHAPKALQKVYFSDSFHDEEIKNLVRKAGLSIQSLTPGTLAKLPDHALHQGVVAQLNVDELTIPYSTFIENLSVTPDTCLVLLGEIQDPQNVGALIRTAVGFGIAGVLLPEHNQAPLTGSVVKVSAGMAFRVPLVVIPNVNTVIRDLKEKGFWVYGLEAEGETAIEKEGFEKPTVIILGNEAKGIRSKTREYCDIMLSIPINPRCESLNVAASGAIALHAWSLKHPGTLK